MVNHLITQLLSQSQTYQTIAINLVDDPPRSIRIGEARRVNGTALRQWTDNRLTADRNIWTLHVRRHRYTDTM